MAGFNCSVIVPVYHSEPYLKQCCQSLFFQTLADIEYLFILDGPSEKAEAIINQVLAENLQRKESVRVIFHGQNQGISYCRQEGHELATGKYLFHCDSDDWMEYDALQSLVEKAEAEQADIVYFDYIRHYENSEVKYSSSSVMDGEIATIDAPLHNKLIRKEFVKKQNLNFPLGINWGEDLCMSVLCQILAGKIAYLPQTLYHRRMHQQSFTSQICKDKYMQLVTCPQYIETELQKSGLDTVYSGVLMQMKFEVKEYFLIHPQLRDIEQWKSVYPECHPFIWQFDSVPFYLKCMASLIAHSFGWFASLLLSCRDIINGFRKI